MSRSNRSPLTNTSSAVFRVVTLVVHLETGSLPLLD